MVIIVSFALGFLLGFIVKNLILWCSAVGNICIFPDDDETYMTLEIAKGKLTDMYSKKRVVVNIVKHSPRK